MIFFILYWLFLLGNDRNEQNFFELLKIINLSTKEFENHYLYQKEKYDIKMSFDHFTHQYSNQLNNLLSEYELELIHYNSKSSVFYLIKYNLILKRLKVEKTINKSENEGKIVSMFDNENIIKSICMYDDDSYKNYIIYWTVFECLDIDLSPREYSLKHISKICDDVSNALVSMQKKSIVHFDIKSYNVLGTFKEFDRYNFDKSEEFLEYVKESYEEYFEKENKLRAIFDEKIFYCKNKKIGLEQKNDNVNKMSNEIDFNLNCNFYIYCMEKAFSKNEPKFFNLMIQVVYFKKNEIIEKYLLIYVISKDYYFVWKTPYKVNYFNPAYLSKIVFTLMDLNDYNSGNKNCKLKLGKSKSCFCNETEINYGQICYHKNCKIEEIGEKIINFKTIFVLNEINKSNYLNLCLDSILYKLIDFDLAQKYIQNRNLISYNHGTFDYIAPEILYYEKFYLNTDMWSLGCLALTLYEPQLLKDNDNTKKFFMHLRKGNSNFLKKIIEDDLFFEFLTKCFGTVFLKRFELKKLKGHSFFKAIQIKNTNMLKFIIKIYYLRY
ncbi:hypothetical protein GVAV_000943 [Gurleya vavrai]